MKKFMILLVPVFVFFLACGGTVGASQSKTDLPFLVEAKSSDSGTPTAGAKENSPQNTLKKTSNRYPFSRLFVKSSCLLKVSKRGRQRFLQDVKGYKAPD